MSKLKKVLFMCTAYVLVAAIAVGGTLAYFTDRDSEVNTFTVGDVAIDLTEEFEQGAELIPGVKIDKNAEITNIGKNDAWVWLTVLLPKELGPYTAPDNLSASNNVIHWNIPKENVENIKVQFESTPVSIDPDGDGTTNEFYRTSLLYKGILSPQEATGIMFSTVYMDTHIDIAPNGDWYWVKDGETTKIGWNTEVNGLPKIYVSAYAIQAEQFADVEEAYEAYNKQWGENGAEYNYSTAVVSNLEELRAALAKGGNVILATDIVELDSTNVVPTGVESKQPDTLLNITKDVVLNLNGHTIALNSSGTTTGSVINVQGATLDIRGEGKIIANDESDSDGWLNGIWAGQDAVVNIYGGEFSGKTGCVLYGFKNGVINIYDGTYIVNTDSEYYDTSGRWLNVNNSNAYTYITLYGGTFVNFNFDCPNMTQSDHDKGNVAIADGYKGVVIDQPDGSTLGYIVTEDTVVVEGTDKAAVEAAINKANDGDTVMLSADTTIAGYAANNKLTIDKAIILDLNGKTLTTECGWGGIDAKGGCSIINGTINHTGNTAAIKAFQVEAIENVTINVTETEGKTKGGIVVQNGDNYYVGSIKDVTINGATNGIECYHSTAELAIGSMENVKINAAANGIYLNGAGRIGKISGCEIVGGNIGINAYLANLWHISLNVEDSTISGGTTGVDIWDEAKTNTGSTVTFNYDDASVFTGSRENIKVTLQEEITCTINGSAQGTPCDVRIK